MCLFTEVWARCRGGTGAVWPGEPWSAEPATMEMRGQREGPGPDLAEPPGEAACARKAPHEEGTGEKERPPHGMSPRFGEWMIIQCLVTCGDLEGRKPGVVGRRAAPHHGVPILVPTTCEDTT